MAENKKIKEEKETMLNILGKGFGGLLESVGYIAGNAAKGISSLIKGASYAPKHAGIAAGALIKGTSSTLYIPASAGEFTSSKLRNLYKNVQAKHSEKARMGIRTYENLEKAVEGIKVDEDDKKGIKEKNKHLKALHDKVKIDIENGEVLLPTYSVVENLRYLIKKKEGNIVSGFYGDTAIAILLIICSLYLMSFSYTGYAIYEGVGIYIPELKFFLGLGLFVVALLLLGKRFK